MTEFRSLWKEGRTARKRAKLKQRAKLVKKERDEKADVRKRDRFCRFPHCGCRALGLKLIAEPEVSHEQHKGMGGNPAGDRSTAELMVYLCRHRHQDAIISRHKGTLRAKFLTPAKFNGPIVWMMKKTEMPRFPPAIWKLGVVSGCSEWLELARESAPQVLEPLTDLQRALLLHLNGMEL